MKLCVGSVFAADDQTGQIWLDLQLQFLQATTRDFDHFAVVWGGDKTRYFEKTNAIYPKSKGQSINADHLMGLRHITSLFRDRGDEYTHFLYLDCDAFPIKRDWLPELVGQMEEQPVFEDGMFSRTVGRNYDIAAVVRAENLEKRLHASVLLVKKEALSHISFSSEVVGMDLRGNVEKDIHLPEYEDGLRNRAFALMRSNKNNLHPLACGIYYNMFYHHGCGVRKTMKVRATSKESTAKAYWEPFGELETEGLTEQLVCDPTRFVSDLAGWTPTRYAVLS